MRTHYVLIDFENVQPTKCGPFEVDHFELLVFVGANQNKLSVELAESIQRLGTQAKYIRISGNGKNALDFHIAFYIGEIASSAPNAHFHIVSKDTGFDPLIQHLRSREILVSRVKKIESIPILKKVISKPVNEHLPTAAKKLRQMKNAKPKTTKTLISTINSHFSKRLSAAEIQAIVKGLENKGFLSINDSKVTYSKTSSQ